MQDLGAALRHLVTDHQWLLGALIVKAPGILRSFGFGAIDLFYAMRRRARVHQRLLALDSAQWASGRPLGDRLAGQAEPTIESKKHGYNPVANTFHVNSGDQCRHEPR